jgi:hypothetical protein
MTWNEYGGVIHLYSAYSFDGRAEIREIAAALFHVKQYPWPDWPDKGCTGLGIRDFMTGWQAGLNGALSA